MNAPIAKTSGNVLTNNRVVIWKGAVGTLIVLGATVISTLSGNDWASMTTTQHVIACFAIAVAVLKNIESLLADTTTYAPPETLPVKPAEEPTAAQVEAAKVVADAKPDKP